MSFAQCGQIWRLRKIYADSVTSPQPKFAAVGVTTFCDNNARGLERVKAFTSDAGRNQQMTIRGLMMNTIEYYPELAGRPEAIKTMQYEDDYMRFRGFKFLLDGCGYRDVHARTTQGTPGTWRPGIPNN